MKEGSADGRVKIPLPKPKGHRCFACGTANPIGLGLHFFRLGDRVGTEVTLERNHEGWENMSHGGITSTLLDETMSWAVMYFKRAFFVTRKMELKYVRPVPIGTPLTVTAKVSGGENTRIRCQGEIRDGSGRLYVRSRGEFVLLEEDRLDSVPPGMKEEMRTLFACFEEMSRPVPEDLDR